MESNAIWPRPQLNPLPIETMGELNPRICLNGNDWRLGYDPTVCTERIPNDWGNVTIPRQYESPDGNLVFGKALTIPEGWQGRRVFLRFDGANCLARVYVDGRKLAEHYGGFVAWDCELPEELAVPGTHELIVHTEDKPMEVNPFHRGGLLRDVTLYSLPKTYISRLHADVDLDSAYRDGYLTVLAGIAGGEGTLSLTLISPSGQELPLPSLSGTGDLSVKVTIPSPMKWDSEHPNLYTLSATLVTDGIPRETAARDFGFRKIEKRGNKVYVNGDLLKLHGVNRHDIHPITGRSVTHELVEEDVRLFKEANINFIRTSHYPPRPDFLDLCDRYGIYVEDEIAVAFLGQGQWYTQTDPAFTHCFMGQFSEMIERDRSHPAVIIYSLANECYWGENLAMMNTYAHASDPSRLTIFSYPITQHEDDDRADIWSMHYAAWGQDPVALVDSFDRSLHEPVPWPVLHDESTHIPCYDRPDQRRDIGVRDFWGETIRQFWNRLYDADGALGCAIWAGIDDVWLGSHFRFFGAQWGIIDGWRRPKPEYWHVRKAYAPVEITGKPYADAMCTLLPVRNRFNHTPLNEVKVTWKLGKASGSFMGPALDTRSSGVIRIPAAFVPGEKLEVAFVDHQGFTVNEGAWILGETAPELPALTAGMPDVSENDSSLTLSGPDFSLRFSKATGLIEEGKAGEKVVVTGGPHLQLTGLALAPWKLESFSRTEENGTAVITSSGSYGAVKVTFRMSVDASGLMKTDYTFDDMPYASPRKLAMRIGDDTDSGGYEEVGVAFDVPAELDTLSWKRVGPWTVYPEWHIARTEGTAPKYNPNGVNELMKKPSWDWKLDEEDRILFGQYDIGGRGTRDFSSMKSGVLRAELGGAEAAFTALSDGRDAVRMQIEPDEGHIISDRDPSLIYQGSWIRRDTRNRSFDGTETWSCTAGDTCTVPFTGTGIAWYTSFDLICGTAEVFVDGEKTADISLGSRHHSPGFARGYEKEYRQLAYSVRELPMGEHTLTIRVTGEKARESINAYVNIDRFVILDGHETGTTRFVIDSEFNYPELSWGCYTKPPVRVWTGYTRTVYTRIGR